MDPGSSNPGADTLASTITAGTFGLRMVGGGPPIAYFRVVSRSLHRIASTIQIPMAAASVKPAMPSER